MTVPPGQLYVVRVVDRSIAGRQVRTTVSVRAESGEEACARIAAMGHDVEGAHVAPPALPPQPGQMPLACPACGYMLHGVPRLDPKGGTICPECGTVVIASTWTHDQKWRRLRLSRRELKEGSKLLGTGLLAFLVGILAIVFIAWLLHAF